MQRSEERRSVVVCDTETWLNTYDCIPAFVSNHFAVLRSDRASGQQGGEVAIIFQHGLRHYDSGIALCTNNIQPASTLLPQKGSVSTIYLEDGSVISSEENRAAAFVGYFQSVHRADDSHTDPQIDQRFLRNLNQFTICIDTQEVETVLLSLDVVIQLGLMEYIHEC